MQQGYLEQRILASWNFAPPFEWTEAQKAEIKIGILKHLSKLFPLTGAKTGILLPKLF